MSETLLVAALSLAGTVLGSGLGVVASARLVNYRLEQLERRGPAHNSLVERTYLLEGRVNEAEHTLQDMKKRQPAD